MGSFLIVTTFYEQSVNIYNFFILDPHFFGTPRTLELYHSYSYTRKKYGLKIINFKICWIGAKLLLLLHIYEGVTIVLHQAIII